MDKRRGRTLPLQSGDETPYIQRANTIQLFDPSESLDDDDDEVELPPPAWRTAWAAPSRGRQVARSVGYVALQMAGLYVASLIWRYVWREWAGWQIALFTVVFGGGLLVSVYTLLSWIVNVARVLRQSSVDIDGVAVTEDPSRFFFCSYTGELVGPIDTVDCNPRPQHGQRIRLGVWLPSELVQRVDVDDHTADPDCRIYVPPEVMSRVAPPAEPAPSEPAAQAAPPS